MKNIKLETKRLSLVFWKKTDANFLAEKLNNYNITKNMSYVPYPYTKDMAVDWLSRSEERLEKGDYVFKIVRKEDGKIVGNVNLTLKNPFKSAEFGYWICEDCWGKGYATEALNALIDFGFNIGVHKIIGRHYKDNPASGKVMQKCGMVCEGEQKEQVFKNGIYHDMVLYGIINKKER